MSNSREPRPLPRPVRWVAMFMAFVFVISLGVIITHVNRSDAGRQDLRYAGAGADAETDAGTAVLPPRGVRCHCASFPVSGMVTDGPS